MLNTEKVLVTAKPVKDTFGQPGTIDSVPAWTTDRPDLVVLQPAVDGLSCEVLGVLTPPLAGTALVTATAIANGVSINGAIGIVITLPPNNAAIRLDLTQGTPEPQVTGAP